MSESILNCCSYYVMRNDTSVTGGRAADKSALSAARRVCLSLTAGSPDLSGALPFPLHQSLTCCSLLPSSLLQSSISFLSCRAESWFLDFIVGIAMSTGSPTPQGPFRTVCALGGLCARVFARFGCMVRAESRRSQRKTNPFAAGIPPKTAKNR